MQILPVNFKTFKTIDVKNPNQIFRIWILSNRDIDFIHQPETNLETMWKNYNPVNLDLLVREESTQIRNKPKLWKINFPKASIYQSNKREYKVFARPSLLIVAPWVSRLLLIISSGVIIIRLHNASSSPWASHLNWEWTKPNQPN